MSDREFEAELKKLNTPYSSKSPVVGHRTRKFLTNLSFIIADAWRLCDAADYCLEIVNEELPDPLPDLGRLVHPGEDANRNCICVYMRKLGGQMVRYGEGNCPRHTVVIRASQATATLFTKLKPLCRDRSLLRAQLNLEEIFRLVAYHGKPTRTHDEYRAHVTGLVEDFLRNLTEYAETLEENLADIIEKRKTAREQAKQAETQAKVKEDVKAIRETTEKTERKTDIVLVKQEETRKTVNRIDQRDKKAKGKQPRFSIEKQEIAFDYWERGRKMPEVKAMTNNGRKPGHEHVYAYFKCELQSVGFPDSENYDACLGCRSDRIQRSKKNSNPPH